MPEGTASQSRKVAEESREQRWQGESFLRELFMGRLRPELLLGPDDPFGDPENPRFRRFYESLERFLRREVDPVEIDESGEYPRQVLDGLARLGAFGMKIPIEYGGLGLTHREYVRAIQLLGSYDANLTALLSAHQAIGVPHPVQMFGTEQQKKKYLPRCARGAISAFALTEPAVGSDPARLASMARAVDDSGDPHFVLDGLKLWCTNGTLAEVIVVLARDPDTNRINAFIVETDWPGVQVERRCHFMGLRALGNALISFRNVRVPRENLLGPEGHGLRLALATLNTGRLTLPAGTAGAAKLALEVCRKWASVRTQWGRPIGEHEAIGHRLADMASVAYAMECVAEVIGTLADRSDRDLRLEAAAAKEWNTTQGWELTDSALQIRGGRGYETERSLAARGEPPIGLERMLRDSRINRIFEGSSEIMHLFIAREALDKHLQVAGTLVDPHAGLGKKLRALPRIILFYALWYPRTWLPLEWFRYGSFGVLSGHTRYAARVARKLARKLFHAMIRNGAKLEHRQALLFRAVDVALLLFALLATLTRANRRPNRDPGGLELCERFARDARVQINRLLHDMRHNTDADKTRVGLAVLKGRYAWLERGTMHPPFDAEELRPRSMQEYFSARTGAESVGAFPMRERHGHAG